MAPEANDDVTVQDAWSQQTDDSTPPDAGSSTDAGTKPLDELTLARRRQAGAEAARQAAQTKADTLQKQLDALNVGTQTQEATDTATLKEQLRIANERISKHDADKTAAVLDVKFPTARAKFPEITDEVRLAELEGFFGDTEPVAPKPLAHNESRTATPGQGTVKAKTAAEVEAELLALPNPFTR